MEGQQLQRDDAQDALQAVHTVRHFDGAARVLDGLMIVFVTDHDGASLQIKTWGVSCKTDANHRGRYSKLPPPPPHSLVC